MLCYLVFIAIEVENAETAVGRSESAVKRPLTLYGNKREYKGEVEEGGKSEGKMEK